MLWYFWEVAFPGKSFNKFHGMFCTIREFVHKYEMTGRVSEESNESFNATLAEIKYRVKCMPMTKYRIETTNARTKGNLKGDILDEKISLKKAITGEKRGPQKPRVRTLDNDAPVHTMRSMYVIFKGEKYFKLASGNLIPKKWQDIVYYEWFASGIAPSESRETLDRTAPQAANGRIRLSPMFVLSEFLYLEALATIKMTCARRRIRIYSVTETNITLQKTYFTSKLMVHSFL